MLIFDELIKRYPGRYCFFQIIFRDGTTGYYGAYIFWFRFASHINKRATCKDGPFPN